MPPGEETTDLRRRVPSVEQVLRRPAVQDLEARHGRTAVLRHLRRLLETLRQLAIGGDGAGLEAGRERIDSDLARRLEAAAAPSLRRVINATGVVIHTNLGRAPLPVAAARRVAEIASSYSNLEFDLIRGERGDREIHAEIRLREMLGAEAALVVNNNAAAVLLAVNTLAEGREVLVSRGELVEIGGSFRIPEILRKGGARLREVGTTNRTRIGDFRSALSPETALILKVHPSNYRVVGFTEAPALEELLELSRSAALPLVEDLGSGLLAPGSGALAGEPVVGRSVEAGVDLVTFSGDKLAGGPQAGLVVGRKERVEALRRNPLYRALRVDKMTIAALDAVLAEHEAGRAEETVPVLKMLSLSAEAVRSRAEAFRVRLQKAAPQIAVSLIEGDSAVGGGAAPAIAVPTLLLAIQPGPVGSERLVTALRAAEPPVLARVAEGRLLLDLRTVPPEDETALFDALVRVAADVK